MLTPVFDLEVHVATPQSIGRDAAGERRCVPITGGTVIDGTGSGRLRGVVLPGGADWQTLRADGLADLDARYMLQLDSGARVEVWSRGLRVGPAEVMARLARGERVDPSAYYMRTAMRFETAAADLQWLVQRLHVGLGERKPDQVRLRVFAVD